MADSENRRGRPRKRGPEGREHIGFQAPSHLRMQLEAAAEANQRSLSAEAVARLEQSFQTRKVIEDAFGGQAGLQLAIMLTASFQFTGGQHATAKGHPEWTPAEWMADRECFEEALFA